MFAMVPAAQAAEFVPGTPEFSVSGDIFDGPISASIRRDGIAAGTFTDTFVFTIPQTGTGSGSVITSTTGLGAVTDLDFLEVLFNNVPVTVTKLEGGLIEMAAASGISIVSGVQNTLSITYESRGNGSYGGQLTFAPGAVPEPATWALLLLGFGTVGFAMRRRNKQNARVQFAF